jgi:Domain of unknown function (DUF4383)
MNNQTISARTFARVFGVVFLLVGIVGFIPGLTPDHVHPGLAVQAGSGMELGLFPVNVLHNLVHIVFGIWGVLAARSFNSSHSYALGVAIIYGILTILGLFPGANMVFGLVPIYGHDIWLHALLAVVAAYFAFVARERSADTTDTSGAVTR